MEYRPATLKTEAPGIVASSPAEHDGIVVLSGLTNEYRLEYLRPLLDEILATRQGVVLDMSRFTPEAAICAVPFFYGAINIRGGDDRYVAPWAATLHFEEAERLLRPKLHLSIDDAVADLLRKG